MIPRTFSAFQYGIHGKIAHIEAAGQPLPPQIQITGLAAEVVKESRERIRVALGQLGFDIPRQKIIVHLSPANSRKEGSQFDLPIALAVLSAEGCLGAPLLARTGFLGELGLNGQVRRVRNIIPLILAMRTREDIDAIYVPEGNAEEVSLLGQHKIRIVRTLAETIECLNGKVPVRVPSDKPHWAPELWANSIDDIVGNEIAKRALEIALAGRHHLLLIGSPGVGKSMLAGAAPSLLPPLLESELVELAVIQNATNENWRPTLTRPFRSPHHSVSANGFVGGGSGQIIPGELSLAHRGILFLDEFPEFRRDALEGLREPLQTGEIHIHRLGHSHTLPARFILLAAMNPCPCGQALSLMKRCSCNREKVIAYRKKISGPIVDRMDLGVVMAGIPSERGRTQTECEVKNRIEQAWNIQFQRYGEGCWNGDASVNDPAAFELSQPVQTLFKHIVDTKLPSMRMRHKLLRVSRTIADLEGSAVLETKHLEEAWALRCPDLHALNM